MVVKTKALIRQERKTKISGILKSLFFLAVLVIAVYILIQSPLFAVQKINVEGNKFISQGEAIKLSGLHLQTNIFRMDFQTAKKNIMTHPMIEEVNIKRQYPNQVMITLTERKPLANLLIQGGFIEVDAKGFYLRKVVSFSNHDNLPIISGVKYGQQEIGQQIKEENLVVGLQYLKNCPESLKAQISEINVTDSTNIIFYTLSGLKVIIGDESRIKEKVHTLMEIFHSKGNQLKDVEYIDVSFNGDPVVKFNKTEDTINQPVIDKSVIDNDTKE